MMNLDPLRPTKPNNATRIQMWLVMKILLAAAEKNESVSAPDLWQEVESATGKKMKDDRRRKVTNHLREIGVPITYSHTVGWAIRPASSDDFQAEQERVYWAHFAQLTRLARSTAHSGHTEDFRSGYAEAARAMAYRLDISRVFVEELLEPASMPAELADMLHTRGYI